MPGSDNRDRMPVDFEFIDVGPSPTTRAILSRMPDNGALKPIIAIIPVWNAGVRLPAVLDALAGQVHEIVCVDNGSEDGTADLVVGSAARWATANDETAITLIRNPDNRGYAEAVNQGMTRALTSGAAAILLVNDDAVFQPGAVAALAAAIAADPRVGSATAHMTYADEPDVLNGAGGIWLPRRGWVGLRGSGEADDGRYARAPEVDYPSGAAALLRREAVETVGGMDERFYLYYEDADWGLRARRAGWRNVYVPTARVIHAGWSGTRSDPARRRYYNVRNRLLFARLHATWSGRLWVIGATARLLIKQIGRWWFPSRRREAEAVFAGVVDNALRRYGRAASEV